MSRAPSRRQNSPATVDTSFDFETSVWAPLAGRTARVVHESGSPRPAAATAAASQGVHLSRVARCDCHHWHLGRAAVAGGPGCAQGGTAHRMRQQPQAADAGHGELRRRQQDTTAEHSPRRLRRHRGEHELDDGNPAVHRSLDARAQIIASEAVGGPHNLPMYQTSVPTFLCPSDGYSTPGGQMQGPYSGACCSDDQWWVENEHRLHQLQSLLQAAIGPGEISIVSAANGSVCRQLRRPRSRQRHTMPHLGSDDNDSTAKSPMALPTRLQSASRFHTGAAGPNGAGRTARRPRVACR